MTYIKINDAKKTRFCAESYNQKGQFLVFGVIRIPSIIINARRGLQCFSKELKP